MTEPDGSSGEHCGTSAAAPAVAGIAALMLSVNPRLTPTQVIAALEQTSVPVAGLGGGRIDAYRALLAVGGKPPPPPPSPPPPPIPTAPAPPKRPPSPPGPKLATRTQHGILRKHRFVWVAVKAGRLSAKLQSPKANACTVSLRSDTDVWLSAAHRRGTVTVAATVPAGKYKVDVWCNTARPRRFSLVLRAVFA